MAGHVNPESRRPYEEVYESSDKLSEDCPARHQAGVAADNPFAKWCKNQGEGALLVARTGSQSVDAVATGRLLGEGT